MAGACVVGMCMVGDMLSGGHAWRGGGGMQGRRDSHCSGRYASYWNAFLSFLWLLFCALRKIKPAPRTILPIWKLWLV